MTYIFSEGGDHAVSHVPVVDPGAADGAFALLWLVIALPLLGALVLLVGGPLARGTVDRLGHYVGTAMSAASFLISLMLIERR